MADTPVPGKPSEDHLAEVEAQAMIALAEKLNREQRPAEALQCIDQAIARRDGPRVSYARAQTLNALGRSDEALAEIDRGIALNLQDPALLSYKGWLLLARGRYDEAMACMDRALALQPYHVPTLNVRGVLLQEVGLPRAARESFEMALAIEPRHAQARWNRSLLLLKLGEFNLGWREYEWRWENPDLSIKKPPLGPMWAGQPLDPGERLLLHCEQGLGDVIQFSRLATEAARTTGARVLLVVHKPLKELLATLEGVSEIYYWGERLPGFDHWCSLLSLPHALRLGAGTAWHGPYIKAQPAALLKWRRQLPATDAPRVALVWSGNPGHARDARRSMQLAELLPALPRGPQYLSLQQKHRPGDKELLETRPDILELGSGLDDFTDTAALCELADLVLTVDTSVAHLAGALGRPLWVMSPFAPDWRWQLERSDSPWYPTARLFRQDRPLHWDGMLHRIQLELQAWLAEWKPRPRTP